MQAQSIECSCCFTPIPESNFDFEKRRGVCPACGNTVIIPRSVINGSQEVLYDLDCAVKAFLEDDMESAEKHADAVWSKAFDNAVALFIRAYKQSTLDKFFYEELSDIQLEAEEIDGLKKMFIHSLYHVMKYEKQILAKFVGCLSPESLAEFVDEFSPSLILEQEDSEWFDAEMVKVYMEISKTTNVPKTWYALYKAIMQNPDSPEASNAYYLKTKTASFYNDFVLGVGKIFDSISDAEQKAKFSGAYEKARDYIKNKMDTED